MTGVDTIDKTIKKECGKKSSPQGHQTKEMTTASWLAWHTAFSYQSGINAGGDYS
jgi:hypothetical protein